MLSDEPRSLTASRAGGARPSP